MLDQLTVESFSPRIGETFRAALPDGGSMDLELVEASAVGGTPASREPFSIVFEGPSEPILDQAVYSLHHDGLGALDIFLVPLGPIGGGVHYEAVFT